MLPFQGPDLKKNLSSKYQICNHGLNLGIAKVERRIKSVRRMKDTDIRFGIDTLARSTGTHVTYLLIRFTFKSYIKRAVLQEKKNLISFE